MELCETDSFLFGIQRINFFKKSMGNAHECAFIGIDILSKTVSSIMGL